MARNGDPYVIGSDIGTSGCKSIVLGPSGQTHGWAIADYSTIRKHSGWAEQNPQDWYKAFCQTVRAAILQAKINPEEIAAICIVGITHNAVLLDEKEDVLRPSIIYTDTRSVEQSDILRKRWGDQVLQRASNGISPLWTWPQLVWIREHESHIWKDIKKILFPKDYIRNRISPSLVSDTIDPVGTLLFNPLSSQWIDDFLNDLGLPQDVYPQPVSPFKIIGRVTAIGAEDTGLLEGTSVVAGTTDTAAEIFGIGALEPGQAFIKLASVGRIAAVSTAPIKHPGILNYPHVISGLWYPGTSTKFAASAFTWARKAFWVNGDTTAEYEIMSNAAANVPPGSEGLIFQPHLDGEFAPSWDPKLTASFLGVGLQHSRPHFTRAVMEGVGFAIRDALEDVEQIGLKIEEIRLIGGGSASKLWTEIICDILQREVIVPEGSDAAFGAALIAGISAGLYENSPEYINNMIKIRHEYEPDNEKVELYNQLFSIYRQAAGMTKEISHLIKDFQSSIN